MAATAPRKVHVVSLGCPKARVDTEVMVGLLDREGWSLSDDPDDADAYLVNTCSFLQSSTEESIETILELAQHKADKAGRKLIVAGCLPSRYGAELATELPEVDTFLGTSDIHRIAEAVTGSLPDRAYIRHGYSHLYEGTSDARAILSQGATAFLKLAEGCNRTCTFCIIPTIRGKQRSRPVDQVVAEARRLADAGVKEVVLVAQDLTSYGTDLGDKRSLVTLIDALEQIDGLAWIRLMYAYPWNVSDDLLDRFRAGGKLLRYLDMPLQHISDRILKDMRRNVLRDQQRRLLARLREIDGMVLRTTFIAGFPGETDAEHRELCDWLGEVRFDRVGVFAYSEEPGTDAATRTDQVPVHVREARRDHLLEIQQPIHRAHMQALVGTTQRVIVDGPSAEHPWVLSARTGGQAPEIDGEVLLDLDDPTLDVQPGMMVHVEITGAADYDLVGQPLPF